MDKKSHIVSFDDARRSVRNDSVRSGAESRGSMSSPRASYAGRSGRIAANDKRGSGRYARSGGRSASSARGGNGAHNDNRDGFGHRDGDSTRARGYDDACERDSSAKQGLGSRLSDRLTSSKRARAKEKADRRFARQYGSDDAGRAAADAAAGPRAAVYKGEMGFQHKRAARMQDGGGSSRGGGTFSSSKKSRKSHPALLASLVVAVCLVFGCVFLYDPAKTYYQEIRKCDRLEAEYEALQQRNEAIQDEVDSLSTDAGVEDKARSEFGWVKEGENAVIVTGIDDEDDSSFMANIVAGSVEAPDTWYSFLDPVFGVE